MSPQVRRGVTVTEVTVRRDLKKALQARLPNAMILRHEDLYTSGIPDLSVRYAGQTSWWEGKYADPHCKTTRIQQHTCTQLNLQGFYCGYIVFRREHKGKWPRQIWVASPDAFTNWKTTGLVISEGSFDYDALVDYISRTHTS